MTAVHHEQIARMWISMKETIFEQLFQIRSNQQSIDFHCRNSTRSKALEVNDLRAVNKFKCQNPRSSMRPENFRHSNRAPGAEVITESVGVSPLLHVIQLFKDSRVKLVQHSFPISVLVCLREEPIGQLHQTIENRHIDADSFG